MHLWLHLVGVEHAGTTPRLQLDPFWDAASQEADTTSCMGYEACRQSSWVKVCPNAPQMYYVGWATAIADLDEGSMPLGAYLEYQVPS